MSIKSRLHLMNFSSWYWERVIYSKVRIFPPASLSLSTPDWISCFIVSKDSWFSLLASFDKLTFKINKTENFSVYKHSKNWLKILVAFWSHFGCILNEFWLHFGFILTAFWMNFDCILTEFWLHFDCILNAFWLHFDCILTAVWLNFNCVLAAFWQYFEWILTAFFQPIK